jgi:nucleotide-binding universal stress UspA family protein
MTLRGPVLVGTDLSASGEEPLRQARQYAAALNSKLIICHVVPELLPDGSLFAEFRQAHLELEQSVLGKARAAVQEHVDTILGAAADADVVIEYGTPHVGLLTAADDNDAGLIVTGPGSVAADVVRHIKHAALISRRSPSGPVVGATDFSDPSLPVLPIAADEARRRGVPLHLVHALDTSVFSLGQAPAAAMPYLAGSSPIALEGLDQLHALGKKRLDDALRETGLQGQSEVVSGMARDVIIRYAESVKASLVIVGTHGRSGLQRLTLGSTAASVIDHAPCSVLVVRIL